MYFLIIVAQVHIGMKLFDRFLPKKIIKHQINLLDRDPEVEINSNMISFSDFLINLVTNL